MSNYTNPIQAKIDEFIKERDWDKLDTIGVYNMLCNIGEETGEIWNEIKWINNDEDLKKVIEKEKDELADGIGDLVWCVARLANIFGVDMQKAVEASHAEYEERFPIDKVKDRSGNPSLGGYDGKYE